MFAPSIELTAIEIDGEIEIFKHLFGDFTETILYCSVFVNCSSSAPSSSTTEYHYDTEQSLAYIKNLENINSPIASNILHLIIGKKPVELLSSEHEEYYSNYESFGFEEQIQLASEILSIKGNPSCNQSAYQNKLNWLFCAK